MVSAEKFAQHIHFQEEEKKYFKKTNTSFVMEDDSQVDISDILFFFSSHFTLLAFLICQSFQFALHVHDANRCFHAPREATKKRIAYLITSLLHFDGPWQQNVLLSRHFKFKNNSIVFRLVALCAKLLDFLSVARIRMGLK